MKVTAIYFSPTETTRRNVLSIAQALGDDVKEIDITLPGEYHAEFGPDEVVVMGGPCYGGVMPYIAHQRFLGFRGNGTPCVAVITYGNRAYDDAVRELSDIGRSHGFIPVGGAAVIGQHTFGEIAVGRPNAEDLALNAEFAEKIAAKLASGDIRDAIDVIPGSAEYKEGSRHGRFFPQTLDSCVGCGICAAQCPNGAIGDDFKTIDGERCLSCFRCIKVCPVKAKVMDTPEYNEFAVGFSQKLAEPKSNEYFL